MSLPHILRSVACLVLMALTCVQQCLFAEELTLDEARQFAAPLVEAERVDGLSVGVTQGNKQWSFHLGKATPDGKSPDDQTLYEIGSLSKVFTALLLATSVVDKTVDLNEAAAGGPSETPLPRFSEQSIRWIDLVTHRSGLPRLPDNFGDPSHSDPYADYDSQRARAFLSKHELRRKPGDGFEYSNFAYAWLGHLVAQRADSDYETLLAQRVTGPLNMKDTVVSLSEDQQARMAVGNTSFGNPGNRWEFADLPGAGAIRSTIADMQEFVAASLHPPEAKIGEAIELAWRQHHPGDGSNFAMGLGWMIARDGQTRFHNGQTGGFHAAMFVNRSLDSAIVVLANTAEATLVDQIAERLIQRTAGMKVLPPSLDREIKVDAEQMQRLVGRYQLTPELIFDVQVQDNRLMVELTNQPRFQVYAKTPILWFYKVVDAQLEFELESSGPAKAIILHQFGLKQKATRLNDK
ncbi:MAG: serine hydrolase [Pirellulaceae bacterium]